MIAYVFLFDSNWKGVLKSAAIHKGYSEDKIKRLSPEMSNQTKQERIP